MAAPDANPRLWVLLGIVGTLAVIAAVVAAAVFLVVTVNPEATALARVCTVLDELDDLVKTTQKQSEKLGILGHGMHQPFETMFQDVFEEMPWHLKEQCDQMLAEQEAKFGPNWKPE